ncbi:hypothetical protein ACXYUI_28760, partial [Klebsiella pneumoniae]
LICFLEECAEDVHDPIHLWCVKQADNSEKFYYYDDHRRLIGCCNKFDPIREQILQTHQGFFGLRDKSAVAPTDYYYDSFAKRYDLSDS